MTTSGRWAMPNGHLGFVAGLLAVALVVGACTDYPTVAQPFSETDPPAAFSQSQTILVDLAGTQACSPGFWRNRGLRSGVWDDTGWSPDDPVTTMFAEAALFSGLAGRTLLQTLEGGGGPGAVGAAQTLLRAAVAAVLNQERYGSSYPAGSVAELQEDVNTALAGGDRATMLHLATLLDWYNNNLAVDGDGNLILDEEGEPLVIGDCSDPAEDVEPAPPPPGRDVVVFNDIDLFATDHGMTDPNNETLVRNLMNYQADGVHAQGNVIWWDRGRNSRCLGADGIEWCEEYISATRELIQDEGFTLEEFVATDAPLTAIPDEVKLIFLWMPRTFFTLDEINSLKAFAEEGGRVVFIGEWDLFYTQQGLDVENHFLINMGAVLRNTGGAVDCGLTVIPGTSLRPHQVTEGMTQVTVACASVIEPGPNDHPLFFDTTGELLLAGVAVIDTEPSQELVPLATALHATAFQEGLDAASPSGR